MVKDMNSFLAKLEMLGEELSLYSTTFSCTEDDAEPILAWKNVMTPSSLTNNQSQVFGRERVPWFVLAGENPPL